MCTREVFVTLTMNAYEMVARILIGFLRPQILLEKCKSG